MLLDLREKRIDEHKCSVERLVEVSTAIDPLLNSHVETSHGCRTRDTHLERGLVGPAPTGQAVGHHRLPLATRHLATGAEFGHLFEHPDTQGKRFLICHQRLREVPQAVGQAARGVSYDRFEKQCLSAVVLEEDVFLAREVPIETPTRESCRLSNRAHGRRLESLVGEHQESGALDALSLELRNPGHWIIMPALVVAICFAGSSSQPGGRMSGMGTCETCHKPLMEVPMNIGDTAFVMGSCTYCDARSWTRDGEVVDLTEVLDLTARATAATRKDKLAKP